MLQNVIYVAPKSSLILMSFLLYKSAVINGTNITDITQQRDMHLVKCNLHGKRFNLLKPSDFFTYHQVNMQNSTWCSLCVECFIRISERTATFALYIINCLVFITLGESVYSAVRTDSLYKANYF
jgi:hypothetical protein